MTSEEFSKHKYGPGVVKELATKLYGNPIASYREAISNALDAMIPYPPSEHRIEIITNLPPDGDITKYIKFLSYLSFFVFVLISINIYN